ncbi:DUF2663 family protein [Metabacillus fastidiosus]|uniref:DUF2663 family protein n=2 Tax=Metabacillus fastidiosus TaxID=1458 RepID=A0ABU6NUC3_9BACI|nr:DUF2663 family protein [Metabacillus fastidiosus]
MRKIDMQIASLNRNYVDEPTKQVLQNLVNKKRKMEKYRQKRFSAQMFTFITSIIFILYIYFSIIKYSLGDIGFIISSILNDSLHIVVVLCIAAGYATALYFKKKEDKTENEFHSLRCEVVRKSTDYWPQPELWERRHEVLQMMKREFDINLFQESK